jgi:enoyl-CoA hydratase/carnithine racemase
VVADISDRRGEEKRHKSNQKNYFEKQKNMNFKTLDVSRIGDHVVQVTLNRPRKGNAMNPQFWYV